MASKKSKRKPKNDKISAELIETQQDVFEAESIVNMKTVKGKSQYLVKWVGDR